MELLFDKSPPASLIAAIKCHSNGVQPLFAIDVSALPQQSISAIAPIAADASNLEELLSTTAATPALSPAGFTPDLLRQAFSHMLAASTTT